MTTTMMIQKTKKRRNCADKLRAEVQSRRILRRKRIDPALSIAIQLLGLAAFTINLFPPLPALGRSAAQPLPEPPPRPEAIRVPRPEPQTRMYKRAPSWPRIMQDLSRPVARKMAADELYARLPVACRPWLDQVVKEEDWSQLRSFARSGVTDEIASAAAMSAFRRWKADREADAKGTLEAGVDGGKVGAGTKPGGKPK